MPSMEPHTRLKVRGTQHPFKLLCLIKAKSISLTLKDAFPWLPTGFGKSVCYETLPFSAASDGGTGGGCSVVLVVSPVVSLIVYQVASLRSRRVTAAIIGYSSTVTDKKLLVA